MCKALRGNPSIQMGKAFSNDSISIGNRGCTDRCASNQSCSPAFRIEKDRKKMRLAGNDQDSRRVGSVIALSSGRIFATGKDEDVTDGTKSGFTAEEQAAIKARRDELRNEANRPRGGKKAADELDVLDKIAAMNDADRTLAERVHAMVTAAAPDLAPKLWYGQPAYARNGKVLCFFRSGTDDGERYSTFGFTPEANLDEDSGLWATSFALTKVSEKAEKQIAVLVKKANI